VIAENFAAREARAAVGAIVLETFERAEAVAPQHEIAPQRLHRMRRPGLDLHGLRDGVPLIEQAAIDQLLDSLLLVRHWRAI
jgi:hypothetical protein